MKPSKSVDAADTMLKDWDDACSELDIPHFLIYGTCLGFYRDGGFIEWDNDIDTRATCNKAKWLELIKKLGEKGIKQTGAAGWSFNRNDLYLSIERSEKIGVVIHDDGKEWPVIPIYSFDTVTYRGRKYNVPYPVEEYLKGRYGEDWKIPNPRWDKYKDAKGA